MGWLEGVLSGYADRHYEIEKQKRDDAAKASEREGQILNTLLSSPYPDIQNMAAAGILDLGKPKKRASGLAGWMGEMQASSSLPAIMRARERIESDPDYAQAQLDANPNYVPAFLGARYTGGSAPAQPSIASPTGSLPQPQPGLAQPAGSQVTGSPQTPTTPAPTTQPGAPPAAQNAPPAPQAAPGGPPAAAAGPSGPPVPIAQALGPGVALIPGGPMPGAPPPPPPAGPPIAARMPAPPPALQASLGHLPGGSVGTVGSQPPPRRTRTSFPSIFPNINDAQRQQAQAALMGKVQAYAEMYRLKGFSDQDAWAKAADLVEADVLNLGSGRSAMANTPMEFDVQQPDGTSQRVMGWSDRRTQQYLDMNGHTFPPDVKVLKAAPYSSFTGDTWSRMALDNLGIHPSQLLGNPQLAQRVEMEADRLAGGRQFRLGVERGNAAAGIPLSAQGRINQIAEWQAKYNTYQTPVRLIEENLRKMAANYAELKKGNMVAWEPFRTSYVHVNENSIVMPSEFNRAGAIGSLVDRINGQIDQWMKGGGTLPPGLVDDMMQVASAQWDAVSTYDQNFRSQVDEALKDPALRGIRPEQIFGTPRERFDPWSIARPQPAAAPAGDPNAPPAAPKTGAYWDPKLNRFVTP